MDNSGNINLAKVNKMEINLSLRSFKTEHGAINYKAIFDIPVKNRIPEMAKKDIRLTVAAITVALASAFEVMNIQRKMNNSQVIDLAETIIDCAIDGDIISLEDVLLFLQKLTRGEYGELYEGIDQVKFMKMFNKYRDERWEAGRSMAENRHLEYKGIGPERENNNNTSLDEHLSSFTTKLQTMKDEIASQKAENKRLRDQNEF